MSWHPAPGIVSRVQGAGLKKGKFAHTLGSDTEKNEGQDKPGKLRTTPETAHGTAAPAGVEGGREEGVDSGAGEQVLPFSVLYF